MNTNSKDVVKNVESNKVESTSNEQRQTNKPIVISRRRLLRAGVAGIPVVLTMAGVAPGIEGINAASAASGLDYDRLGTVNRISQVVNPDSNGYIWSDEDGFVLTAQGGAHVTETNGLQSTPSTSMSVAVSGLAFSASGLDTITANVSLTLNLSSNPICGDPRLHKLGNYYIRVEDVSFTSPLTSSQLSGTASATSGGTGNYNITSITLDNSQPVFDIDYWTKATDSSNGDVWYCLTDNTAASKKDIKSVTIKVASLSISDGTNIYTCTPSGGIDFTFSDIAVDLPTKLE